jgi:hypothetical protein
MELEYDKDVVRHLLSNEKKSGFLVVCSVNSVQSTKKQYMINKSLVSLCTIEYSYSSSDIVKCILFFSGDESVVFSNSHDTFPESVQIDNNAIAAIWMLFTGVRYD